MNTFNMTAKALLLTSGLLLGACSSDDDPPPTPETPTTPDPAPTPPATRDITIGASLGLINDASVMLMDLSTNTAIADATGTLDATGMATIAIPADFAGPMSVVITGTSTSMYFDENANAFLSFPEGMQLRTYLAAPQDAIGVTTFTEIAANILQNAGTLDADSINSVNAEIANMFIPGAGDITVIPTIVSELAADIATNDPAGLYATALAAITSVGTSIESPALEVLSTLSADLLDGIINGAVGDQVFSNPVYSSDDFLSAYSQALTAFVNSYADASLQSDFAQNNYAEALQVALIGLEATLASIDLSAIDITVPEVPTPAPVLPDGLAGISTELQFTTSNNGAPYNLNQVVRFTISSSGALFIDTDPDSNNGDEISIAEFTVSGTGEIIWLDIPGGFRYALSLTSSGINEINVFGIDSGMFLGQFTEVQDTSTGIPNLDLVLQFIGTYNVEAVTNSHDRGTLTILDDGSVDFDTATIFPAENIVAIFDRTNIQDEPRIQINYSENDDGQVIQLFLSQDLSTLERVQFRYRQNNFETTLAVIGAGDAGGDTDGGSTGGGSTGGDVNGVRATVNDEVVDFTQIQGVVFVDGFEVAGVVVPRSVTFGAAKDEADPSACQQCENSWLITAPAEVGTHSCQAITSGMPGSIAFNLDSAPSSTNGNGFIDPVCEITITEISDTNVKGTFTGTLYRVIEGENVVFAEVTDGQFNVTEN